MKIKKSINRKVKRWVYVAVVLVVVSLTGLITSGIILNIRNNKVHSFSYNVKIDEKKTDRNCTVFFEIPIRSDGVKNCWESESEWGSQYDIIISNNTPYKLLDWKLTMKVPEGSRIDSSWNGIYSHEGQIISISHVVDDYNVVIMPESTYKLGFVLYTPQLLTEADFTASCNFVQEFRENSVFMTFAVLFGISLLSLIVVALLFYLLKRQEEYLDKKLSGLVRLCASFIDTRDEYTRMHSVHVAHYSTLIAKQLGYDKDFQKRIYYLGMLHDVGKVMIPREILCKPGKLDNEEWAEMKRHTTYGADITKNFEGIDDVSEAAMFHHERYDGTGYMAGLSGEDIPLEARIICVADSFDAMATDRAYRPHLSRDIILAELNKGKGCQFDPRIAEAMIQLIENGEIKC